MSTDHDKLREAIDQIRLLAQGRVSAMDGEHFSEAIELVCTAAKSTLPRTKTVEVWHVEWALGSHPMIHLYLSEADARKNATLLAQEQHRTCIRVTGPHQQEVPK